MTYLLKGIYNAFFHPLAKVPGPKLWVFSDFFYLYYLYRGVWPLKIQELHKQYGPVVRFTTDEVSFIGPGAWKVIRSYQRSDSKKNFQKDMRVYRRSVSGHTHILIAPDGDHRRHRRLLGYAFSEKALRGQETLIQHYIDLLIKQLNQRALERGTADLTQWLNFITFDIIGDLSFGYRLGNLERGEHHPWVAVISQSVALLAFYQVVQRYPILGAIVTRFIPRRLKMARQEHWELANRMVRKRLTCGDESREDFMNHLLAHNSVDDKDFVENAYVLVEAGSETSAMQLCGTMYYLLSNRDKLDKLLAEICASFTSESEITGESVAKLAYLNACLEESLRMCKRPTHYHVVTLQLSVVDIYLPIDPAIPSALPRIVPEDGCAIEGYWIPGGVSFNF